MMRFACLATALAMFVVAGAQAQISYTGGTLYTQDFNSLSSVAGPHPWTDSGTIVGWYAASDTASPITLYTADNGSSNLGNLYSYGSTGDSDRALGSLADGSTGSVYYGVQFKNASAAWTYTSFSVSFWLEQWRADSRNLQSLQLQYQVSGSPISVDGAGPWTTIDTLNAIVLNTVGAIDGNLAVNRVNASYLAVPIAGGWAPNQYLMLRWVDVDDSGSDHGLAIDDFTFSAVPEPTTFALVGLGMGAAGLVTRRLRRKKAEQAVAA